MLRSFITQDPGRTECVKASGQGLVEYALILVLIAIVTIGVLTSLGGKTATVFSQINSGLGGSSGSAAPPAVTLTSQTCQNGGGAPRTCGTPPVALCITTYSNGETYTTNKPGTDPRGTACA